jgi:hypothetical protein
MKLYEFQILIGQIGSGDHGSAIAGTGMRGGTGKVSASVATRGEDCVFGVEAMYRSIF